MFVLFDFVGRTESGCMTALKLKVRMMRSGTSSGDGLMFIAVLVTLLMNHLSLYFTLLNKFQENKK
jgi:hypothetical protein